jgi:tripartite-type tricarboxylate transporter receptor subunit TctC
VRALAVTTKQPFSALPEVPPLAEAGVPGFDAAPWQGVIAPAHTPPAIVAKLNAELNDAVAVADVRARMRDIGMIPVGAGSPAELAEFLQSEIVRWGKVVEDAGLARSE